MIRWIPYTFVRITLFFIGGVLAGIYFPQIITGDVLSIVLFLGGVTYVGIFVARGYFEIQSFIPGAVGLIAIFFSGWLHAVNSDESKDQNHLINCKTPITAYVATLVRFTEEKERSWKVEARVSKILSGNWRSVDGRIVLYFSKENFPTAPEYGQVYLIQGFPKLVDEPGNPGEFDYKRYLSLKNIYHQHFLRGGDAMLINFEPPSVVLNYAIRTRVWANKTLKKFIPGEREQGVASALVLGVTDGLDNELLQAYSGTGAMHVLAVSGLHITIIYLIIVWFLKPVSKLKSGPWIIAVISLFILWSYAFVTGLSPSVLRAVTMFSFLALAKPTNQSTNIYNTLAASAFCILMFDPFLILSVGFQLSYLAVIGIVYLHPRFYPLWEPENRILDEIWKITSVSIAAQISTLPLGLLYFHQFPNYFLISNLLVIPGSFIVLIGGLLVLVTSFIPVIAKFVALLTAWMIKIINFIVFTVEGFPYSLIENIHITLFQCFIVAAIIVSMLLLYEKKRFRFVTTIFLLASIFSVLQWIHFNNEVNIKKITVYKIPGHSAIDLIEHGNTYFIADSALKSDVGKISFHINPNRLTAGILNVSTDNSALIRPFDKGNIIIWNGRTILQVTKPGFQANDNFRADFVIVGNNAIFDLKRFESQLKNTKIILDSSNSFYFADAFLKKAKLLNLEVHSILHNGSFEFRLTNTLP